MVLGMANLSSARQESFVAQGLALGVLAAGVDELPGGKLDFEFALNHAWRGFNYVSTFPRVGHRGAADPYYALLSRSAGRKGPLVAAWEMGQRLTPYLWMEGWDLEESGEMLAEWSGVPWAAWKSLGADLVAYYRDREKI